MIVAIGMLLAGVLLEVRLQIRTSSPGLMLDRSLLMLLKASAQVSRTLVLERTLQLEVLPLIRRFLACIRGLLP